MRLLTLLTLLITTALTLTIIPRQQSDTCFDPTFGVCKGLQVDAANATLAIKNACALIPTCTPGQTLPRVKGFIKGWPYTAALYVGPKCGGVARWSLEACVGLFDQFVDARCEGQYPSEDGLYQLGYTTAKCDDSMVSLNLGG